MLPLSLKIFVAITLVPILLLSGAGIGVLHDVACTIVPTSGTASGQHITLFTRGNNLSSVRSVSESRCAGQDDGSLRF